jgi:hypothetical protein
MAVRKRSAEPAQSEPAQNARDARQGHPERVGDLGRGEAQAANATITSTRAAGSAFRDRRDAEERWTRPASLPADRGRQLAWPVAAECRVTVKLHPVSSLDSERTLQIKGAYPA